MSKLLRRIGFLGLIGAVALTATACGKKKEEEYKYGELKVSIPTGIIRTSLDIVALEKGFFKEEGVKVTGVNIKGMDALTALNNNSEDLDLLTLAFVPDVQAISNGYDNIRFIGGTAVEGGALITKKGNASIYKDTTTKINFDAIKNAKLGFAVGEAAWVVTNQYLIENDSTYNQSEVEKHITNLKDEQTVAQEVGKGEIEVGFLPLEYANLYKDAYNVEIIAAAGDLIPEYVCCRQATSKEKLEAKKDAFLAYEKARIRAWEYIENEKNKDDVVKTIAGYVKKEEDYVTNYLYGGITKWSVDPNKKGIVTYTAALKNAGVLKKDLADIASYVDTSVYEQAITYLKDKNKDNKFYQDKYTLYTEYNK